MRVRDVMDPKAARIDPTTTFRQAAELLVLTQASDLFVVDAGGQLAGVVSEGDLLRALVPDFDELVAAGGSLADACRAFLDGGRDLASQPIARLIIAQPITVAPDDELLAVAGIMIEKAIRRLPVVDADGFCGTVSRADVAWAVLARRRGRG